jgi:hypothetical protein
MESEWSVVTFELVILAIIIFGAVYVEHWSYRKLEKNKDNSTRKKITILIKNDLERKLRFIDDTIQFKDYKPFFTDNWDAVILSGKQTLFSFEVIESLQHSYSWMKYYNTELQQKNPLDNEKTLNDLLEEVRKSIDNSMKILKEKR